MSADNWRLIDSPAHDAVYNMALDEALAKCAEVGSAPILRFFAWDRPSVTLGSFQRFSDVDAEYCASADIPIVRRPTGGRAILHGNELTYSVIASADNGYLPRDLLKSYGLISRAFYSAFKSLGLDVEATFDKHTSRSRSPLCFESTSYGEISIGGKKVIGSAQRRWPDAMLQQGSIPLVLDRKKMSHVFVADVELEAKETMIALSEAKPDIYLVELKRAVVQGFAEVFGIEFTSSSPDKKEEELQAVLAQEKYSTQKWTAGR